MPSINPYLTFKGNCEEAFQFYKSVFGGEFRYVGRFSEILSEKPLTEGAANLIMHISLPISHETVLMGSDTAAGFGPPVIVGNNISVSITAQSKEEADHLFNGLSEGGEVTMPIDNTFWGDYFGMCTDRFGINWMVSFGPSQEG